MKLTPTMDNFTDYLSGSDLRHQLSSGNDLRRCRVESSNVSFDTSIEQKFFIVITISVWCIAACSVSLNFRCDMKIIILITLLIQADLTSLELKQPYMLVA